MKTTIFDQRGQTVNYQYNVNGTINFASVHNICDVIGELEKLQAEVAHANKAGALDDEIAVDVDAQLKKAVIQAQKSEPEKTTILDYLDKAKSLIEGITSVSGLFTGITEAIKAVAGCF